MLKNLENKNKNKNKNKNNKPNNENKNVTAWLNNNMNGTEKNKIPKNKRVFLLTDLTKNGKIQHVWDRRFLNGLIESAETLQVSRRREVRENNDRYFTSPLTREKFSKNDIKAYPPTNNTKKRMKQFMNTRILEAEVNKMNVKNRDKNIKSDILNLLKGGVRLGTITTKKQIQDLILIYKTTGSAMLFSGHKRGDGSYYKAYLDGKFKEHHMKFMKNAPTVVSGLYDIYITINVRMGNKTIPLHKLSSATTTYLSKFEKYVGSGSNVALNIERFIIHTLRKIVFTGDISTRMQNNTMKEITMLKNKNLRNQLSEYYNWHELAKNAES